MPLPASMAAFLLLAPAAWGSESFGDGVYYLGDLHAHTGYSGDGGSADLGNCTGECGDFATVFDTARANGLDFLAITDHINSNPSVSATEWLTINAAVLAANDPPGGFVTIPGGELWFTVSSTSDRLGHKTLLMFEDDTTLAGLTLTDVRAGSGSAVADCDAIWTFMDDLVATWGDAMLVPHHPAVRMPMPNDWDCHDATHEPAVEVYSEHGNSLDDGSYDTPGEGIYTENTVESALDPDVYGLMMGFVGGTDSHDTRPGGVCEIDTEQPTHLYGGGLTIAMLDPSESFDRPALYDAIVDRRTLVTTGPALPVAIDWSAAGVSLGGLGARVDAPASYDLDVTVSLPADRAGYVTAVDLVGPASATWELTDDGLGVWTGTVPAAEVPAFLFVAVEIDGASWYGTGGCDDGGDSLEWVWSSPSPITQWEDDTDGDGYSVLADDCDDDDPDVHPGALEIWYDGIDQDCDEADDYDQDADGSDTSGPDADCDDLDPTVHEGADEIWYDTIDQDCAGDDDFDQDADGQRGAGFGDDCDDTEASVYAGAPEVWYDGIDQDCDPANEYDQDGDGADRELDCDDTDPQSFPGGAELWYDDVDEACDGGSDWDQDQDGVDAGLDCDDTQAGVYPGATELWYDGIDQDCDGNDADFDRDGSLLGLDCDDEDAAVSPDATERWYDGVDQDCDGASDWDQDADGVDSDAFGGTDCDDGDAAVYPGAVEVPYDGIDQDCGVASDLDADGDGVPVGLDCYDQDPRRYACNEVEPAPTCGGRGASAAWILAAMALSARRRTRRG